MSEHNLRMLEEDLSELGKENNPVDVSQQLKGIPIDVCQLLTVKGFQRVPMNRRQRNHSEQLTLPSSCDLDKTASYTTGRGDVASPRRVSRSNTSRNNKRYDSRGGGGGRAKCKSFAAALVCLFVTVVLPLSHTLGIRIIPKKGKTAASAIPKPHVPFPAAAVQISVVVMNHARPNLLMHSALLPVLTQHPNVAEILILHSNPATAFTNADLAHLNGTGKVQHVDVAALNAEMGLALRFHYCAALAAHDWVMHVDDDMELDASAVNELVLAMAQNSRRIVGHYGRAYNYYQAPLRHGYVTKDVTGAVEVVLTKVLLMEKVICAEFQTHAPLMSDMVPDSSPRWNGEDIFVNLVANRHYAVPPAGPYNNWAIPDLNVWEANTKAYPEKKLPGKENISISGNMDKNRIWIVGPFVWWRAYLKAQDHTAYRGRLWYQAKQRFAGMIN